MKIASIHIRNFRAIADQTIDLGAYTCFVGANGAGKSTILEALNLFFSEGQWTSGASKGVTAQDFHLGRTGEPIRITVIFDDLSEEAAAALSHYVRQEQLAVTLEVAYGEGGNAQHRYYGERLGMAAFASFFDSAKSGAAAQALKDLYAGLRGSYPNLPNATSKAAMSDQLRAYEEANPDECTMLESDDDFYGARGRGKLDPYVQWVYVPAVKDVTEEGAEAKNTALGKLVERTVRTKINFDQDIENLQKQALEGYQSILSANQNSLSELENSLQRRLEGIAYSSARVRVEWQYDPAKSVSVQHPLAAIQAGDGEFLSDLSRVGHGLQRSYLLALLQELAESDAESSPTLLLGVEEPELYQHPPQARHLVDVFEKLCDGNTQVLVTTHSPLFVRGRGFEKTRVVRADPQNGSSVSALQYENLFQRITDARGKHIPQPTNALIAKVHQLLQPRAAELFFTKVPVLVEGLEDASYITAYLHLSGKWEDFCRLGCQLIPVYGKSNLIQSTAIAIEFGIPAFVIFDGDGDAKEQYRPQHEKDNNALLLLLGSTAPTFPPEHVVATNHAIWKDNIGEAVKAELQEDYEAHLQRTRASFGHEKHLDKNDLFIAELLNSAFEAGWCSEILERLCKAILEFARRA